MRSGDGVAFPAELDFDPSALAIFDTFIVHEDRKIDKGCLIEGSLLALGASSTESGDSPFLVGCKDAGAGERDRDVRQREHRIPPIADDAAMSLFTGIRIPSL